MDEHGAFTYMNLHEVYQMHCQYCWTKIEAPTREEAYNLVLEHESKCERKNKELDSILKTFQEEK